MTKIERILMLVGLAGLPSFASAEEVPEFTAICQSNTSHRYDTGATYGGDPMPKEWSTGEKFLFEWTFTYTGGESILINGQERYAAGHSKGLMIRLKLDSNLMAASIWTYMINFKLEEIVATQLNGSDMHIKGRLVTLDCDFSLH